MTSTTPTTLATLPPALLRLIFPVPAAIRSTGSEDTSPHHSSGIKDNNPHNQEWLAIQLQWPDRSVYGEVSPHDAIFTLRSLSQTCKSLRNYAIPLLWSVVHVSEISQLGRLAKTLEASPSLARHVRSFVFLWQMDTDLYWCNDWEFDGSLLELAFKDRFKLWDERRQSLGCEAKWKRRSYADELYFAHDGKTYEAPGSTPPKGSNVTWNGFGLNHDEPRIGGSGPDGKGEDRLIKTPQQFQACVTEVIRSFTSLETFGWSTFAPMPQGVFDALASLTTLTSLHVDLGCLRDIVHALPLWKLAGNLERLSLDPWRSDSGWNAQESEFASFELPTELPTSKQGRLDLHWRIAARTIVTAARSGKLKSLKNAQYFHPFFALRSLLPCWVGLELPDFFTHGWLQAAMCLRSLLAHFSLWMDVATGSPAKQDRRLTRAQVQRIRKYYSSSALPEYELSFGKRKQAQPIEDYLPWFEQDVELARQVADAWNSVVAAGRADVVRCGCERCRAYKRSL